MIRLILACIPLLLLLSCASSPRTHYYHLSADGNAVQQVENTAKTIVVSPIFLPALLDRQHVISEDALPAKIVISNQHLWTGDLSEMMESVVVAELKQTVSNVSVFGFPAPFQIKPDLKISITIDKFSGTLGGAVQLRANWIVVDKVNKILLNRHSQLQASATDDSSNYVLILNRLLVEMSHEIADELKKL